VAHLDARSTEPVTEGRCFEPATGVTMLAAVRQPSRRTCPEPPSDVPYPLGLEISASETIREFRVGAIEATRVTLVSDEGVETYFNWYGPDPRRALREGERVVARRYDRDVTMGGFLDVIEVADRTALAVISMDDFTLTTPNLSIIDLEVGLGEACVFEDGVVECTGETLYSSRYPVMLTLPDGNSELVTVGETGEVGPWLATVLEATQYPGMFCPEIHVEAWGPFGLTLMQELNSEE
jgi:hypothetical protein